DQAEPETVRSALAWHGREKTAKGAIRNSMGQRSDRARYLSRQTCRSRGGRGGIPRSRELPQIQSALVVWAGSHRRKALQQRAFSSEVGHAMGFRLKLREPLPEGLKRVFREEIDSALHICQNPAKERGVTVHEVRKHLKKLRAAVRLAISEVGKNCHAEE